jgi:hypothetical protein
VPVEHRAVSFVIGDWHQAIGSFGITLTAFSIRSGKSVISKFPASYSVFCVASQARQWRSAISRYWVR